MALLTRVLLATLFMGAPIGLCLLVYLIRRRMQAAILAQESTAGQNNELPRREPVVEVWELPSKTLPTRIIQPLEAQHLELQKSQGDHQGESTSASATDSDDCRTPPLVLECAICLSEMEPGDVVMGLPCSHEVHAACFKEWETVRARTKQSKPTCPLCRASLGGALGKHEAPAGRTTAVTIEL